MVGRAGAAFVFGGLVLGVWQVAFQLIEYVDAAVSPQFLAATKQAYESRTAPVFHAISRL